MKNRARNRLLVVGFVVGLASTVGLSQPPTARSKRVETLVRGEAIRTEGQLSGGGAGGFRFVPAAGRPPIAVEPGSTIEFSGAGPEPHSVPAAFQVLLGNGQRISGRLVEITPDQIRIDDGPGRKPLTIARRGALAVIQRPGEAQILVDPFDVLDPTRWTQTGEPEVDNDLKSPGGKYLKLPAGGASVTARIFESVTSGRLEISYFDRGERAAGYREFVDLAFRTPAGELAAVRTVLGWPEETLAVESPQGPGLAVQPLTRKPGWHRLTVRFGPDRLDIQVDQDELAHGNGPSGPLAEIRLATEVVRKGSPAAGLFARFDDLHVARIATPSARVDIDPGQDEVRMVSGDQTFGRIVKADSRRVLLRQLGKDVSLPWSEVSGVYFERAAEAGQMIDGLLVRAEWRAAPPSEGRDFDVLEGALVGVTETEISLATPYASAVTLPRDHLTRLLILGKGRRLTLDATSHHLGDRVVPDLDPPQPEGGTYEIAFDLDSVPDGPARLAVDVVQVVGESGDSEFSPLVRKGELVSRVSLNGKAFDTLNHHIMTKNEAPERIRLPIPSGLLRSGRNVIRVQQEGAKDDPSKRDNLGLLGIALEFDSRRPAGTARP